MQWKVCEFREKKEMENCKSWQLWGDAYVPVLSSYDEPEYSSHSTLYKNNITNILYFLANITCLSVLIDDIYLTSAMFYIKGQGPSPSINGWYMVCKIYGGHMIPGDECGPNFLTLSYDWGKTPEKTSTRKLTRPRIDPGPAARETTMLPPDHSSNLLTVEVNKRHQLKARFTTSCFNLISCKRKKFKICLWRTSCI